MPEAVSKRRPPDHGVYYGQDVPAEVVMVPETTRQGPIDKKHQYSHVFAFTGSVEFIVCSIKAILLPVMVPLMVPSFFSWATNSNGTTKYPTRSSRRNTARLIGGTGSVLQLFSSSSTASRHAGSETYRTTLRR